MKPITAFVFFTTILVSLCMPINALGIGFLDQKFNNFQSIETLPIKYKNCTFDQLIEHPMNMSTFRQRYWFNSENYKQNGPIILFNVGEHEATDYMVKIYMTLSFLPILAKELNAILVVIEHRYYGHSKPFEDYSGKNMSLLTPEQSLEDMAYFIQNVKFPQLEPQPPPAPQTPWIIYGCSYAGILAAWMRKEYPSLVFASVSTSAPVQLEENFWKIYDPILKHGPPDCIHAIKSVVERVDSLLLGNDLEKQSELKKMFGLEILENDDFGSTISLPMTTWQKIVPGDDKFAEFCSFFNHTKATPLNATLMAYATYFKSSLFFNNFCYTKRIKECFDTHNSSYYTNLTSMERPWFYQTCAHFGYYKTAPPKGYPTLFSRILTEEYYQRKCAMYFGRDYIPPHPNTTYYNNKFDGWNISLDRIIWVNGEKDPWRSLSVASPDAPRRNSTNQTLYLEIPNGVHCWDLLVGTDFPLPEVEYVQSQINITLSAWLEKHYNRTNFTSLSLNEPIVLRQ